MKAKIIFLSALVIMVSFSLITSKKDFSPFYENKKIEFKTFTSAVCENKQNAIHCKDNVFVNCNGKLSKAADVSECNGIKMDIPKETGFAVFEKDWKDPRT